MNQVELFDLPPLPPPDPNSMVNKHGLKEGYKCKSCGWLHRFDYHCRIYYKCECRGISHSYATDMRISWNACNLWKPKEVVE